MLLQLIIGCVCAVSWFIGSLSHREKFKEVSHEKPLKVPRFILRNILSLITVSPWLYWAIFQNENKFKILSLLTPSFILYTIGQSIFWSAKIQLKAKIFTENINNDDTLIDQGPYRYIRHPGYCGWIISCVSTIFFTKNVLSFIAILIPLVVIPYYLPKEEAMKRKKYGDKFTKYCNKTKYKIFPFLY